MRFDIKCVHRVCFRKEKYCHMDKNTMHGKKKGSAAAVAQAVSKQFFLLVDFNVLNVTWISSKKILF